MKPAIIWGFGQLGTALASAIEASPHFALAGVVDHDPAAATRLSNFVGSGPLVPFHPSIADVTEPAVVFHATTSAPDLATAQVLAAIQAGHSVLSAAEWLFHPWLRFADEGAALDASARERGLHVLGCGINPGFCFEALPLVLARTAHGIKAVDALRVANVGGIGPSDFAHLGFGLEADAFAAQVAAGAIEGHMGFPESVAALAERLPLAIDRITDHLEPTLAVRPHALPYRTVAVGEVVGITQRATGFANGEPVIRFVLDMFLDPAGYDRVPREEIAIVGSRTFRVELAPAAPPASGAAAMMVQAAAALAEQPPGLVSLLDLPLGGARAPARLRAGRVKRSSIGSDFLVEADASNIHSAQPRAG